MNIIGNLNLAASAAQWNNQLQQKKNVETTGAVANNQNNDPLFKNKHVETTGAVAMFDGLGGMQDGRFLAVA